MATRIKILQNMIKSAACAEPDDADAAGAEIRAYMLEPETLAELVEHCSFHESRAQNRCVPVDAERLRAAIDAATDAELPRLTRGTLDACADGAKARAADAAHEAAQALADAAARSCKLDVHGEVWTFDPAALFAAAKAAKGAMAFAVADARPIAVDVAQLKKLAVEAKRQKWSLSARLEKDHVALMPGTLETGWGKSRKVEATMTERKATGWALIVQYTRPSGSRGRLRFIHNHEASKKVTAFVTVARAANEVAA